MRKKTKKLSISEQSHFGVHPTDAPPSTGGEGLRGPDKTQDKLQGSATPPVATVPMRQGEDLVEHVPEGLRRERKHPLNPSSGRAQ